MKKSNTIWGNCLVKNEEKWVWYAIMSVIDRLDKLLVWDTGSTDRTVEIIKTIKSPKIIFKEYGPVTKENYPEAREKMLRQTKADWTFIIDGDEVWTKPAITKVIETIDDRGENLESIVVKTINWVGDVFHYQEEAAGQYVIAGKKGHYNLRAMNMKIPGLHAAGPHGKMGYFDDEDKPIQNRAPEKIKLLDVSYFHATHLPRSSAVEREKDVPLRLQKRKFELGLKLPESTVFPEVFYIDRPVIVPDPWSKMSKSDFIKSLIQTPFKMVKRRIVR